MHDLPYDDDDRDDASNSRRPNRNRRAPNGASPNVKAILDIVAVVAWCLLFVSIAMGGLLFCNSLNRAQSAPQEAALGAVFSTVFIGLYIVVRCIEKVLVGINKIREK